MGDRVIGANGSAMLLRGPVCSTGFTFGWTAGGCGDFDGDGYGDAVIGSAMGSFGTRGLITTYCGSPAGLTAEPFFERDGGDFGGGHFGIQLATGDLNGDQRGDLLVTAEENTGGNGRGFLFPGVPVAGPSRAPTLQFASPDGGFFGSAASLSLDLDGDGYGDVVVVARSAMADGVVYVYPGSGTGPSTTPTFNVADIGSSAAAANPP